MKGKPRYAICSTYEATIPHVVGLYCNVAEVDATVDARVVWDGREIHNVWRENQKNECRIRSQRLHS